MTLFLILYSGELSKEKTFMLFLIPYSGKLLRGKTFRNWSLLQCQGATPPNFAEKTFANSNKTAKFVKVFSLESFPLYSNQDKEHFRCPLWFW